MGLCSRYGLILVGGLLAQSAALADVYTCTTASGHKLTADRPIAECADREQRQLETTSGLVKIIPPRKTEAERIAAAEAVRKQAREKEEQEMQQRNDQQLLVRYPDDATLEEKRSYMLGEVKKRWAPTLSEEADLEQRRAALQTKAVAQKAAGKSADLDDVKAAAQIERRMLQLRPMLDKASAETAQVNAHMDADLKRLHELRAPLTAAPGASAAAPARH